MQGTPNWQEPLEQLKDKRTLIVGMGNAMRGDDGIGPAICEALNRFSLTADILDVGTVPENYIEPIVAKNPQALIILDAIKFNGHPGDIRLFDVEDLNNIAISTHVISPRMYLDLINKRMDVTIHIIGIEPSNTAFAASITPPVEKAVRQIAETLKRIFIP